MDIAKTIESLPKYAQVLYNDCLMYSYKDRNISHPLRKELIMGMLKLVRAHLDSIESHFNEIDTTTNNTSE